MHFTSKFLKICLFYVFMSSMLFMSLVDCLQLLLLTSKHRFHAMHLLHRTTAITSSIEHPSAAAAATALFIFPWLIASLSNFFFGPT